MEGTGKRFIIPVYQRNYDWKIENCKQLFDDLIEVKKSNRESHFFGCIVSSCSSNNGRITEYSIIDGQQRLTTVSLLLLAMHNLIEDKIIKAKDDTMANQILQCYLIDKYQPKVTRIKLKPVKDDKNAFERLFDKIVM